jgi:hypothetical protein
MLATAEKAGWPGLGVFRQQSKSAVAIGQWLCLSSAGALYLADQNPVGAEGHRLDMQAGKDRRCIPQDRQVGDGGEGPVIGAEAALWHDLILDNPLFSNSSRTSG